MRYITQCIEELIAGGHRSMEPRQRPLRRLARTDPTRDQAIVWSQPSIEHSFYKNAAGEVHGLSPWRLVDYWSWTRTPDFDDFVWR